MSEKHCASDCTLVILFEDNILKPLLKYILLKNNLNEIIHRANILYNNEVDLQVTHNKMKK